MLMVCSFWTDHRIELCIKSLLAGTEWTETAKYFSGRIRFEAEDSSLLLSIESGHVTHLPTSGAEADISIKGPDAVWLRVADGELDWFKATTPPHGDLVVEGDLVYLMRNIKIFWLIVKAIGQTGKGLATPQYSPPPQKRQAPSIGRYVEVDGIETYYEEAGSGPVILCLHAASQDTLMYRHVLAGLSDEYRVIAVDAPGHGKSQMPAGGPFRDLTKHALFHERIIEILGIERPVLLGCSMAGNEVLELAARRPGGYAAVVSSEGADYTPGLGDFVLDMLMVNGQQIVECYSQSLTGNRTPPDRAQEVIWQLCRATPEIMRGDLEGYAAFDKRAEMGRIIDPVLLVRGDEDWLVSQEQVEATAARIPNSKIVILEGTGHYPMIENPAEFNNSVRTFLQELRISQNLISNGGR